MREGILIRKKYKEKKMCLDRKLIFRWIIFAKLAKMLWHKNFAPTVRGSKAAYHMLLLGQLKNFFFFFFFSSLLWGKYFSSIWIKIFLSNFLTFFSLVFSLTTNQEKSFLKKYFSFSSLKSLNQMKPKCHNTYLEYGTIDSSGHL